MVIHTARASNCPVDVLVSCGGAGLPLSYVMDWCTTDKGLVVEYWIVDLVAVTAHSAPPQPLSLELAHRVMQVHSGCSAQDCRNKRAAYEALVTAGHLVPDSSRRASEGWFLRRTPRRSLQP